MAIMQTKVKTEDLDEADPRTAWQKAEYERRRTCFKKDFKNICVKHLQFLKRKETIVDSERLAYVWQLYLEYKYLNIEQLLQHIVKQEIPSIKLPQVKEIVATAIDKQTLLINLTESLTQASNWLTGINSAIKLLTVQLEDLQHDNQAITIKNAFLKESLLKFNEEFPENLSLQNKDFVNVLQEDKPSVQIDGKLISTLASDIRMQLINTSHKLDMEMYLIIGNIQAITLTRVIKFLTKLQEELKQQQKAWEQFVKYFTEKKTNLATITSNQEILTIYKDFIKQQQTISNHGDSLIAKYLNQQFKSLINNAELSDYIWQLLLIDAQELIELNIFAYRVFVRQEKFFLKNYRRNQANDAEAIAELESKLLEIREYRNSMQSKLRLTFRKNKEAIMRVIAANTPEEEIAKLKTKHKEQMLTAKSEIIIEDIVLPLPPMPINSQGKLTAKREAVIIAIAQTICEALGRLAIAASTRESLKSPQEHVGIYNFNDQQIEGLLAQHINTEEQAMETLSTAKQEICKLGEEINQLIKELE